MYATYFNTSTTSTTPAPLIDTSAAPDDIRLIKKIIIGNPAANGTLILFNENNALSNNTTQILFNLTLPTASSNTPTSAPVVIDFTTNSNAQSGEQGSDGLQVRGGGSMAISTTLQVTVLWDYSNT